MNAAGLWISTKDRLPEEGVVVLVRVNADSGSRSDAQLTVFRRTSLAKRDYISWKSIESYEDGIGVAYWDEQITHWAEITAPPNEPKRGEPIDKPEWYRKRWGT